MQQDASRFVCLMLPIAFPVAKLRLNNTEWCSSAWHYRRITTSITGMYQLALQAYNKGNSQSLSDNGFRLCERSSVTSACLDNSCYLSDFA